MHRANVSSLPLLPTLLLALAVTGCDVDSVGVDDGSGLNADDVTGTLVRVLLTDGPSQYIGSAHVDIGRVELVPADGGEHVILSEDGTDGLVNLLELQNAATTPIAEASIEPGSFSQLRLMIEAARVELAEGYQFRDGSTEKDLTVPSGAQTGIKLNLQTEGDGDPLVIVPGETVLVLDFDVSRSYVLQGNPETPAGVHGVIFKPTIRVTAQDVAASISGVVTTAEDGVSVGGLTVTAEPTDGGDAVGYQTQTGTTITAEDGTYTIHFLVPGSYDVTVDLPQGLSTDPGSRLLELVANEDATGADFEVVDVTGSISGTVGTALQGVSVEGLTVTAQPETEGMEPVTAETASDGTYTIESVLPGSYTVTVEAGDDMLTDPADRSVDVGNDEDVTGVDFQVVEDLTGSISGTVTTALAETSVEGLTVTAQPEAQGADAVTATTAADGTYTIDSVPAGNYTVTVEVGQGLATDPANRAVEIAEDEEEVGVDFAVVQSGG